MCAQFVPSNGFTYCHCTRLYRVYVYSVRAIFQSTHIRNRKNSVALVNLVIHTHTHTQAYAHIYIYCT